MFNITSNGDRSEIEVKGRLDTQSAPELMEQLKSLAGTGIKTIVFKFAELEYISSAGIRAIIFAKQRIGKDVDIVIESANEAVRSVFAMSGLEDYVEFMD